VLPKNVSRLKRFQKFFSKEGLRSLKKRFKTSKSPKEDEKEKEKDKEKESPESKEPEIKFNIAEGKCPLIVLINVRSGAQLGANFIKQFYHFLNPIQIIDIIEEGLEKLKIFTQLPNIKIVVGGGDGSIGSVVSYIKKEIPEWAEKHPPVAILPLGTGNDLSIHIRALI